MRNSITISLVIPTFNRADLVSETIQSALNQQTPFNEILVVDDASTDNTIEILKRFGDKIKIIASQKIGVQMARNKGVQASASEYVTLCDSDDLLAPNYVQTITDWLVKNPRCDTIYSNFRNFTDTGYDADKFSKAPPGYFEGADKDGDFLTDIPDLYGKSISFQPLFSSGVTIRKSFYQKIGGYNPFFNGVGAEDWEYTLRTVERGVVSVCTQPLVFIRRHKSNDSRNPLRQLLGEIKILEYAKAHHISATKCEDAIKHGLNQRRIDAFELAFGIRDYDTASKLLAHVQNGPKRIKYYIKAALIRSYSLVRSIITKDVDKLVIEVNKPTGKT